MGKNDDETTPPAKSAQAVLAAVEPTIVHFIDPPFQIRVEGNLMHIDAPCLVAGDKATTEVLRFSLSAAAAMVIKEALDMITFVEELSVHGGLMQ